MYENNTILHIWCEKWFVVFTTRLIRDRKGGRSKIVEVTVVL